jgi:hypothetical protein
VFCTVSNGQGGSATDSVLIPVRDFSQAGSGGPILSLPFSGTLSDVSGYNNQLTPTSLLYVADRFGTPNNAVGFNGATSCLRVTNTPVLNCDSAITVGLWMKPGMLFTREMFLISHGSWQNRWKISLIPEGRIRWTVRTTAGVRDVDSRTVVASGVYHFVTGTYNGTDIELYVDGEFETFTGWSGRLLTPSIDLTVGQMLPTDANYNFQGVIDDIQIYNYALTYPQVQDLFHFVSAVHGPVDPPVPLVTGLVGTYPNPFNAGATIKFQMARAGRATPLDEQKPAGTYLVRFDGSGLASGVYFCRFTSGDYREVARMLLLR